MYGNIALVFFAYLALQGPHLLAESKALCYQIPQSASPENIELEAVKAWSDVELWCYVEAAKGELLIFNADQDRIRVELAFLIKNRADSGGKTISYASLSHGKLQLLQQDLRDFLPNIPLSPEQAAKLGTAVSLPHAFDFKSSQLETLELFRHERLQTMAGEIIEAGYFENQLAEASLPFDGYWWPHTGIPMTAGDYSPLGKYDAAIQSRTGQNPGAMAWERRHHSLENVPWGGHCNGWAASSVLYPKVPGPLWDAQSQHVFQISDLDGILAEANFCVQWAFFGNRNNGRSGDDPLDISPALFHRVVRHYIDIEKKPIAFDYQAEASVDNNIISGYKMTINPDPNNIHAFRVETRIRQHYYSYQRRESVAKSDYFDDVIYTYELTTDEEGRITGGTWLGKNPDFLWVPLAQKLCGRENPNVDHHFIEDTLMTLPLAQPKAKILKLPPSGLLGGGQTAKFFQGDIRGSEFILKSENIPSNTPLTVTIKGYHRYPVRGQEIIEQTTDLAAYSEIRIPAIAIQSIEIKNQGALPLRTSSLGTLTLEYLGGD